MRLYRQKRATLGQQGRFHSFVGSVSHWGENGAYWGGQAAYSLFTIWERMGRQTHPSYQCETYAFFFLLGSEFLGRTERSELSSSQLVKKQGGEVRRGGRPGCCQGAPVPSPGFALQNLLCKRAHYPLGKGTFGICPCYWTIYIENRRKLLRSLRRENGEKRKKRGLQPGKTRRETPQKGGIRSKVSREGPIRSMENEFGNSLEKSPQTRMKPNKNGLNI